MSEKRPANSVSIVIPCRNHAAALERCLTALAEETADLSLEIVVVDSSDEPSAAEVLRKHAGVTLVKSTRQLMPGAARNRGAAVAKGEFLLFVDADCTVERGWLQEAVDQLRQGRRAVGGPVLHGAPWHPIAVIDNLMQFLGLTPAQPAGPVQLLPSCNFGIGKADFQAIGGFPELEHVAGEDVLYFAEARRRWPDALYFHPDMRVRHFGRTSWRSFLAHQFSFGYIRAFYALELKKIHLDWGCRAWMVPAVAARRLYFLYSRALTHPQSLCYLIVLFPILLAGVSAWSIGFHKGCKTRADLSRHEGSLQDGEGLSKTSVVAKDRR
ncbi:MAG TPA: glycosyltransferase [Kiloniellaceae bacterium]|nr:glycosyltransferase [Kiloniellaceae bacterium]